MSCRIKGDEVFGRDRISTPQTKHGLRALTEDAITRGVFGVPTFLHGEEMFWGHDRLDQLAASLAGETAPAAAKADAFLRRPRGVDRRRRPPTIMPPREKP